MHIKVLGAGCTNCKTLYQRVERVLTSSGLPASLEKVERIEDIMAYGVMSTPALVIDEKVKSSGRIPSEQDILGWLTAGSSTHSEGKP